MADVRAAAYAFHDLVHARVLAAQATWLDGAGAGATPKLQGSPSTSERSERLWKQGSRCRGVKGRPRGS